MKRLFNILMIAVVALPLVACGNLKGDKKGSVRTGRAGRGMSNEVNSGQRTAPFVGQQSVTTGQVWSSLYGGSLLSDQDFNWNLQDFVAATMDPSQMGYVSSQENATTGIRFHGRAQTSTVFNPNMNMNANIVAQNSELRIVIWDSFAGHNDSTGELITEIPVHMVGTATGEVVGRTARVRFSDSYGWIELYGTFDGQYFRGNAFFDNTNGYANYLGMFAIPTCSFFRCN